jgi:flavin-dependent dehydrogenase
MRYGFRFVGFREEGLVFVPPGAQSDSGHWVVGAKQAVVGADGVRTEVGSSAGIGRPASVPILQAEVQMPGHWNPDVTQVWFDTEKTPFFFWLIPESKTRGVAGLIGSRQEGLRILLDEFLQEQGLVSVAYQGAEVAMYHPGFRPWAEYGATRVILVGDAAGHVKATTVGGTVTGFAGAHAAYRSILKNTSYSQELGRLNRELNLHWWIRRGLNQLDNKGYARLLELLSEPVRSFLSEYDRDSMASAFWRLPFREPRLLGIGTRCLLSLLSR